MKRASLKLLVLVVAAILALGWWTTRPRERSGVSVKNVALPKVESTESAQLEPVEKAIARSVGATTHGAKQSPSVGADSSIRRVLVVDEETQEPVRDADVRWTLDPQRTADASHPLARNDPEDDFEASTARARSDELGLVWLPKGISPQVVWARLGDRFGSSGQEGTHFSRSGRDYYRDTRVELSRRMRIDIHVVDAGGNSVSGVPVSIREKGTVRSWAPVWTGVTGSGGLVRTTALRRFGTDARAPLVFVAGFEFPTKMDPNTLIDPASPPRDPLLLVMPECGSVAVQLNCASGPTPTPEAVKMHVPRVDGSASVFAVGPVRFGAALVDSGEAHFPFVETGLVISISVQTENKSLECGGRGPSTSGERVSFAVDVGTQRPRLAGTFVDASGALLADALVHCRVSADGISLRNVARTDANGHFEFALSCDADRVAVGVARFELTRNDFDYEIDSVLGYESTLEESGHRNSPVFLPVSSNPTAVVELALRPSINDLGTVVLRSPYVLASGLVVDESGAGVRELALSLEVERSRDGISKWENCADLCVGVRGNSEFVVSGVTHPGQVRIRATAKNYMQIDSGVIEVGTLDARICMSRSSEICGRLLLDETVDPKLLRIYVRATDESRSLDVQDNPDAVDRAESDGAFHLRPVRSRLVDLIVCAPGWKEPLVALRDLDLRTGGRARDPRLLAIDLRGRILGNDR